VSCLYPFPAKFYSNAPLLFDPQQRAGGLHLDFGMWETMNLNLPPFVSETIADPGQAGL
jgi:hypothetical protein